MTRMKIATGVVAGAALLVGGATGAFAHGGGPKGFGPAGHAGGLVAYGTLSTISGTTASVTTPSNGSVNVTLASGATYTAHSQAAAIAGLKSGVQVAVHGTSLNGTVTARSLDYDATPFVAAEQRYTGTVSSATTSSLVLATSNGSVTFTVNGSTTYVVNGAKAATQPAFSSTQQVRVTGALYTDGTLVAQSVTIGSGGKKGAAPIATATSTS